MPQPLLIEPTGPVWLDNMIRRVRTADSDDAARAAVRDFIDPKTGERVQGDGDPDEGDTHVHIHLEGKSEGDPDMARGRDEFEDPNDPAGTEGAGTPSLDELAAQVAALSQRVAQLEEGDEGEMELTDPDTKDARRYSYRRGAKIRSRDEADPDVIPVVNEEMIGETDLPGIEDLDKRMVAEEGSRTVSITVSDRRRARDRALRMTDSADMEDTWRDMIAVAEVIQPGVRVGTFDSHLPVPRQAERMCAFRRRVVDAALRDRETGEDVAAVLGRRTMDGAPCETVKMAFHAIGALMRSRNNDAVTRRAVDEGRRSGDGGTAGAHKIPTPAEMNKVHAEFWAKRGNGASR